MAEPRKMSFAERQAELDTAEVSSAQQNLATAHRMTSKHIAALEKQIGIAKGLLVEIEKAGDDEEVLKDYDAVKDLYEKARAFRVVI